MKWISTPDSSALAGFGYDPGKQILKVRFRHGATYSYLKVSHRVFEEMEAAPSKGRFVTDRIKSTYDFEEEA